MYWHNLIYDSDYYACNVDDPAIRSVGTISESIITGFAPRSIIDVGCGSGALLLNVLRNRGCDVLGLEYSDAALRLCRRQHVPVLKFNLEKDSFTDRRTFDLVISMEVAEHLTAKTADRYVTLLTSLSSSAPLTAAPPGQGGRAGTDHINEQRPSIGWPNLTSVAFSMMKRYLRRLGGARNGGQQEDVALCYYQNLMIFTKPR